MEQFLYYVFYYKITYILGNIEITAIFFFFIKVSLFLKFLYLTFT